MQILVAFALFDTDGDGQLTLEELTTCIASVLRVVCAVGQDVKGNHIHIFSEPPEGWRICAGSHCAWYSSVDATDPHSDIVFGVG